MDLGDERRVSYSLEQLKELMAKSTKVVNWYPHMECRVDVGATVRGPFCRWFEVLEVVDDYKENIADPLDDAKYAAACMNAMPHLISRIEELEAKVTDYSNKLTIYHGAMFNLTAKNVELETKLKHWEESV